MPSVFFVLLCDAFDGEVVRFACARGIHDLTRVRAQPVQYALCAAVQ